MGIYPGLMVIDGDFHYEAKLHLLKDEIKLLKLLAYKIITVQPHKLLYTFANAFIAHYQVVRFASCLINDLLLYSDAVVYNSSIVIAYACLAYTSEIMMARGVLRRKTSKSNKLTKRMINYKHIIMELTLATILNAHVFHIDN